MAHTIVLWEPRIPQNVGSIARLCAGTNSRLHLVGQLGFLLSSRHLARAGLDYWPMVDWHHFIDANAYRDELMQKSCSFYSTKAKESYADKAYDKSEFLVFGGEDRGLPEDMLKSDSYHLPIDKSKVRSLNLSQSVAIVLYEALRQNNFFTIGD
ncbi:MAG: tRNA (cytidine(34)-2'-O)-methyltransferase [SAR324 cluster bacterium]|nr:tRNA (cytidine(34)-2'-O)-methyltransferase [SAR324 cluster bacterium]